MNDRTELWLHEEVLLLALKDDKGTPHATQYSFAPRRSHAGRASAG